jgi:hypothetical protein
LMEHLWKRRSNRQQNQQHTNWINI